MSTTTKPILAIFGASGNQGHSLATHVLTTPTLSSRYTVRAISRSTSKPSMQHLSTLGAELHAADMDDPSTLPSAIDGATFLFLVTTTQYSGNTRAIETLQAKSVCSEALRQGVSYIIFSSMSHPRVISSGKLKNCEHFDVKAEIETYIRGLPVQSAFFAPASFMQNFTTMMRPRLAPENDGTYVLQTMLPGDTAVPYIDICDTGKFIAPILQNPEKYAGSFFAAAEAFSTPDECAEILSQVTGKTVRHVQLPDEEVKKRFPEPLREALGEMWVLNREYGYFGREQRELVRWARSQVEGEVTGLEGFLRRVGYVLE
jgi:uncharacterized protein YbjT (DUF2867 family)